MWGNYLAFFYGATPTKAAGTAARPDGAGVRDFEYAFVPGGISTASTGFVARNGLAPMPAAWRKAIRETFLRDSQQLGETGVPASRLGNRNLWIESKVLGSLTAAAQIENMNCGTPPGAQHEPY